MSKKKQQYFDEINVGRMNVVDDDGTIRMSLSSKERFPAPFEIDGEPVPREGLPMSGITFYNDDGFECGGLTFASEKDENGHIYQQAGLSFDPYMQNDAITLGVEDQNGQREMEVEMYDRPTFPITDLAKKVIEIENASEEEQNAFIKKLHEQGAIGHSRIRVAKTKEGEAEIKLSDSKGKPRIRMVVDTNDEPKLEFLDKNGEISLSFP